MKYFIILASASIILLYGACKISTANTKIENSISPDTFRLKGAAVMAFYEPYTIHKLYVIGGVYTPNGDTLATLQAKNDVSFEAKIT